MEFYQIGIYIIIGVILLLCLFLIYLLIHRPKELLFQFLRYCKNGAVSYSVTILLFPIWGPAWLLDKQFGLGIWEHEEKVK